MSHLPVEIIPATAQVKARLHRVLGTANAIQSEFQFLTCNERSLIDVVGFAPTSKLSTIRLFEDLESARSNSRG